jgi:hypothetical protein
MPDKLQKSIPLVVAGVIGVAVGWLVLGHADHGKESPERFRARLPPVEFLYLDGTRIANYLAQLEGGQRGAEHRITKETTAVNGEAGAAGFKIGASSQLEDSAESTLTQTAASEFEVLLRDLRADTLPGVSVHPVDLSTPAGLDSIHEGWLVRFRTDDLLSPGYIRPYVVVRQSATLAALFPPGAPGDEAASLRATEQRREAEAFAKRVGPNPRITFVVSPLGSPLKILLPMHYKDLTDERSLLEKGPDEFTGGELTVVGKVIRNFPSSGVACPPAASECSEENRPDYTDFATREIWRHPLEEASNYLIENVSHNCGVTNVNGAVTSTTYKNGGLGCYLHKLREQTELLPPGAVILPIAVYK